MHRLVRTQGVFAPLRRIQSKLDGLHVWEQIEHRGGEGGLLLTSSYCSYTGDSVQMRYTAEGHFVLKLNYDEELLVLVHEGAGWEPRIIFAPPPDARTQYRKFHLEVTTRARRHSLVGSAILADLLAILFSSRPTT